MSSPPPPPPPPSFSGSRFGEPPPGRFDPPGGSPPPPLESPGRRKRGPFFWVAIGVLGCLAIPAACVVLFGGLAGGVFYLSQGAAKTAHALLEDVRKGDLDAAYARFTEAERARLSRAAFGEYVAARPALREHTDATLDSRRISNDRAFMAGYVVDRAGKRHAVALDLVREGDEWRVVALRFGDEAGPASDEPDDPEEK